MHVYVDRSHVLSFILGAHTNHIEGCWRHAKAFVCPQKPATTLALQRLLNVYMWRKWLGEGWPGGPFARLLNDVHEFHRVH